MTTKDDLIDWAIRKNTQRREAKIKQKEILIFLLEMAIEGRLMEAADKIK